MPRSSETVSDPDKRQYHIALAPGEVEQYILLCGDPDRAGRVARFFDSVRVHRQHREYVTFTGAYKGVPLSVMATGIGCDNTDIAVVELSEIVDRPTFIRIGSCGALQPGMDLGSLIVTHEALRGHEDTSLKYAPPSLRVFADRDVERAIVESCERQGLAHHVGTTCPTSSFYAGQGRKPARIQRIKDERLAERLGKDGVANFEMETGALFTLANVLDGYARAGAVCAVYANRPQGVFADAEQLPEFEQRVIVAGLAAVERLAKQDATPKWYTVLKDGKSVLSPLPGRYAGHRKGKVFGTLDCASGKHMKPENRVFFNHLLDALEQGYRPCKNCKPISASDARKYRAGRW